MKRLYTIVLILISNICFAQQIKYTVGHNDWDPDSLGNHRVVLSIAPATNNFVIIANIDWRRSDEHPEDKEVIVVDAISNQRILNVIATINRETCFLQFQPTKSRKYYVYYMSYKVDRKSNYPNAKYLKPEPAASKEWLDMISKIRVKDFATVDSIESINQMNSFYPMEVIAKASEVKALEDKYPAKKYMVFPEDRLHIIKMKHDLPQRWIISGLKNAFTDAVDRGENYSYQLGIYPVSRDLEDVKVVFSDLKSKSGKIISSKVMSCLNNGGVDYKGEPFTKQVNVAKGDVQAMWCLLNIPENASAGIYEGTATVTVKGLPATSVKIVLKANDAVSKNSGINEPQKETRLTWLNSTMA